MIVYGGSTPVEVSQTLRIMRSEIAMKRQRCPSLERRVLPVGRVPSSVSEGSCGMLDSRHLMKRGGCCMAYTRPSMRREQHHPSFRYRSNIYKIPLFIVLTFLWAARYTVA